MSNSIMIPVSPGELLDKISILQLKQENISDEAQLHHVRDELKQLHQVRVQLPKSDQLDELFDNLRDVNQHLWNIEDGLRAKEVAGKFDQSFIEQARMVYINNDKRAAIKRAINELLGSTLQEQKSYTEY
ncbi:MAG: DUF6165 family protein [Gammaproteobacteria bacterium]|nr:DUF6165 family protein [Gammaproteobacteria bacterium]